MAGGEEGGGPGSGSSWGALLAAAAPEVPRRRLDPAARALEAFERRQAAEVQALRRAVDERLGAIGQSLGRSEAAVQGAFERLRNLRALTAQVEALGRRGGGRR